jgi:uncharacterized protein YjiS (DUF1127 family)
MLNSNNIGLVFREWRRRVRSRREMQILGSRGLQDLGYRLNIETELRKPFWRA